MIVLMWWWGRVIVQPFVDLEGKRRESRMCCGRSKVR